MTLFLLTDLITLETQNVSLDQPWFRLTLKGTRFRGWVESVESVWLMLDGGSVLDARWDRWQFR